VFAGEGRGPFRDVRRGELAGLRVQKIEHKAVDQFDSMTDDELRQYVYGNKDIDS
jgi:hypothetical protein